MGSIMATAGTKLFAVATGIFAVLLPLILSALVPHGFQRWGGAIFCLLGIAFLCGLSQFSSTHFSIGMGIGFILASLKLITGIRFL